MANKIIQVEWNEIIEMLCELKIKLVSKPEIIIAIQRGGLIPATILSHLLNIRDIEVVISTRNVSDDIHSEKIPPNVSENYRLTRINGKKILIVDDIIGSGATMQKVVNLIREYHPLSIEMFSCYVNLDNWEKAQKYSPEKSITYVGKTVRGWVIFPWENRKYE